MAERKWDQLSRSEKLASVMYPHLTSKEIQNEMSISEQKRT